MSRLSVSMSGGAPWGFRLYGGGSDPLIVAKLRKRSKASEAGMVEGDVLLAINQYSTQDMSHPVAMALVDQARGTLSFEVLRGSSGDPNAVHSALQTLGSQFQAPPTSAPASTQAPAPAPQAVSQPAPQAAPAPYVNGQPEVVRQQQNFSDGNTQRQVTTETATQKFGGTTLTKVTRQEVTSSSYGAPPPQRKPATWAPSGGNAAPAPRVSNVRAPPGVQVSRNQDDQSITLTVGLGDKENRAPAYIPPSQQTTQQNMFSISKVRTAQPKAIWTPSFIPDLPQRGPAEQTNLMDDTPDFQHPPEPEPVQAAPEPQRAAPPPQESWRMEGAGRPLLEQSEDEYARMMMEMIMHGPESPNTIYMKKKKVYADSAFFDDPDHKYPTIEEQIKMARKVALSLESPANKKARGHKMFIKRKEKSYRWVTGADGQARFQEIVAEHVEEDQDEKYYNPDPWKPTGKPHTWQPSVAPGQTAAPPPPPPALDFNWNRPLYKAPTLNLEGTEKEKEEKSKAMSQDEFERMRMFESKSMHNKVSPMVSFKLAEDLHSLKGKGAKLFAKRKAKADAWVVEDKFHVDEPDNPPRRNMDAAFVMKLTGGMRPPSPEVESPPSGPAPASRPRLQAMIEPPKAAMTPWDAAVSYGACDKAFDHLDDYMKMKRGGNMQKIANKLNNSVKMSSPSMGSSMGGQPTLPEFTRKIQPWDQPAQGGPPARASTPPADPYLPSPTTSNSSLPTSSVPKLKPWASTTALNSSMSSASPGYNPKTTMAPAGGVAPGGFRPVKFKAPTPMSQMGSFGAPSAPAPRRSPVPPSQQSVAEEADGFCDL